jgi:MinD-like ATPase involved in chromosome partitioning or flagellar assembly
VNIYYTWHDVKKEFDLAFSKRNSIHQMIWPNSWKRVDVYYDEVVITLNQANEEVYKETEQALNELFGHHYLSSEKVIKLDFGDNRLNILYEIDEYNLSQSHKVIPLFKELNKVGERPKDLNGVPVIAFHSYKGGVGRTLSLLAYVRSLSEIKKGDSARLLIVDSDIEAPGLTWLAQSQNIYSDISFLDALSILHQTEDWREQALPYISQKIQETTLRLPVSGQFVNHYFLPAYRYIEQIMQISNIAEKVVNMKDRAWIITDFLSELGSQLQVDAVIVDLRAGFSEISSPFLFDPRVRKIYVTSTSLQSRKGLLTTLEHVYPKTLEPKEFDVYAPKVLITMVPDEVDTSKIITEFAEVLSVLQCRQDEEQDVITYAEKLNIDVIPFSPTLVHLEGFDSIDEKLSNTKTSDVFSKIALEWFPPNETIKSEERVKDDAEEKKTFLENLAKTAQIMEHAESNLIFDFLATSPLKNIAQKYRITIPNTVVLGAKGSGKTFAYLQLLQSVTWESFLNKIIHTDSKNETTYLFPFIKPKNLNEEKIIEKLREHVNTLNEVLDFKINAEAITGDKILDDIEQAFDSISSKSSWKEFWKTKLLESTGLPFTTFSELQSYLEKKGKRLVFMVDGLEEVFNNIVTSEIQKNAISALCQGIVTELRSIPNGRIGLFLFLRRDIALNAIEQNWAQFYSLYASFELKWTNVEALLLALWLCRKVNPNFSKDDKKEHIPIENLTFESLEKKLHILWGLKLGRPDSREAYSANWIISALSDLNEQLQARDIIRFLRYAAQESLRSSPWNDRYLLPEAIRKAITPCSKDKITELEQEIANLKVIFEKLRIDKEPKQIPFNLEDFGLSADEAKFLEQQGFLIKFGSEGYYMPEIIRLGLGFKLEKGARPKVVVLLNRARRKR